jgi:hypothetical protein
MTTTTAIAGATTKQAAYTAELVSYLDIIDLAQIFQLLCNIKPDVTSSICIYWCQGFGKFAVSQVARGSPWCNSQLKYVVQNAIDGLSKFFTYMARGPQDDNQITENK